MGHELPADSVVVINYSPLTTEFQASVPTDMDDKSSLV